MWNTDNKETVNDTRTIVLGSDGRTDVMATLYAFGTDLERFEAAKALLNTGLILLDKSRNLHAQGLSADVTNGLRKEATAIIGKACWMAPDDCLFTVDGEQWKLDGLDSTGGITLFRPGTRYADEFLWEDVEQISR